MKKSLYIQILFFFVGFITLNKTIHAQNNTYPTEILHVHLQKNIYISGEVILFKLYCINSSTHQLSDISKVAYLELIDQNGVAVSQNEVILNNGMANGGFVITPQLPSGNYAINAYTHWMNSTSKELVTVKPILVFNNKDLNHEESDDKVRTTKSLHFQDLANNETKFDSLLPISDKSKIRINSKFEDLNRYIKFIITSSDFSDHEIYSISINSKDKTILNKEYQFTNGKYELKLHKNNFDSPINNIAIKNKKGNIKANSIFNLPEKRKGQLIEKSRIKAGLRERINLSFNLSDLSKEADSINLSAGIKLIEPFEYNYSILDHLNTFSNFEASSSIYFNQMKQLQNENWILTNNINPIWLKVKSKNQINKSRYPEKEGYVIEGQIKDIQTREELQNKMVYLSKTGEFVDIDVFKTNENGEFYFHLPIKKGLHDISIQLDNQTNKESSIILKSKFNHNGHAPATWQKEQLTEEQVSFLKNIFENNKVREIYNQKTHKNLLDTSLYRGKQNFFGNPYLSIKIDDFIKLDSLEEYFHEFVSPVKIKYRKNKCYMNVYNPESKSVMNPAPLILYDGIIITNPRIILDKKPETIDRIEVLPYEYYYGKSHFYGIIHVISKTKDCNLNYLPKNTERYYLPLFTSSYELDCISIDKNLPDFRTDLLWKPNINLHKNETYSLEFETSDIKGEFELIMEGVTNKGEPILYKQKIIVE